MKAKLLTLFAIFSLTMKSQITLENSYPATSTNMNLQVVELVKYGYKYSLTDLKNHTLNLYNLNHSLFKNISLPVTNTTSPSFVANVSDSLFNTDNLIEVAYYYYNNPTSTYETKVINEQGSVLITILDGSSPNIVSTGANGFKMLVSIGIGSGSVASMQNNVYSLVGALPIHTASHGNPTGLQNANAYNNILSAPIPNPSSNKTSIAYQLPQGQMHSEIIFSDINGKEVKRYQVDNTFSTLELDNSDLPSGTYFYKLNGVEGGKKMVIIK